VNKALQVPYDPPSHLQNLRHELPAASASVLFAEPALLLAAAICQGGIAALPLPEEKRIEASFLGPAGLGKLGPDGTADAVWPSPAVALPVPPTAEGGDTAGVVAELPLTPAKEGRVGAGRDAATAFMRLPTKVLRLLNSVFSSLSLPSVFSFCASIAFGIRSFKVFTSSLIRLASSSRLRLVFLRSPITASTSCSAASRRSVRVCSDALSVSVSVDNWSRRANALANASSMDFLSCSSCGGVGGAMRG
jgi:hypothetical protein